MPSLITDQIKAHCTHCWTMTNYSAMGGLYICLEALCKDMAIAIRGSSPPHFPFLAFFVSTCYSNISFFFCLHLKALLKICLNSSDVTHILFMLISVINLLVILIESIAPVFSLGTCTQSLLTRIPQWPRSFEYTREEGEKEGGGGAKTKALKSQGPSM